MDVVKLRKTAGVIFRCIADAVKGVADAYAEHFDLSGGADQARARGTLRVVSALAAGSDQWLADEALKVGFEPQSVLPFSRADYRKEVVSDSAGGLYDALLKETTAVLELDGKVGANPNGNRCQSYAAVGRAVLDQSDLVVAIWDGKDPQGVGGTGQVVNEALQRGIPVVRIDWSRPECWELRHPPWRLPQTSEDLRGDFNRLTQQVRELLVPPLPSIEHTSDTQDLREAYYKERQKSASPYRNLLMGWWTMFRDLMCGEAFSLKTLAEWLKFSPFKIENFSTTANREWEQSWESLRTVQPDLADHVRKAFLDHYAWANGLSVYYANLYRSSFVLIYSLGAFAVFFALLGLVTGPLLAWFGWVTDPYGPYTEWLALIWTLGELTCLLLIIGITLAGWWWRWHERWIDYRTLAESLRLAQFLALLGGGGQQVSMAGHLASYGNPAATWMHWHFRAVERAAGLPMAHFDREYLNTCVSFLCKSLIQEQKRYHATNKHRFHHLNHRLHLLGGALFAAAIGTCLLHLIFHGLDHTSLRFNLLTLSSATLPAMGAALAAIRTQGEFQRVARKSAAMCQRLTELDLDLASVSTRPDELNSVRIRQCTERVAKLMMNEMLDWRVVFQDRPLTLPA